MSRVLKFRAWDSSVKKFKYGKRVLDHYTNCEASTGLKDKNGKEIYEGDILGDEWGNGYISWCDKCKQFQYYIFGECMACSGDVQWYELVADDGKLEVIGNIHENPELLRGEE